MWSFESGRLSLPRITDANEFLTTMNLPVKKSQASTDNSKCILCLQMHTLCLSHEPIKFKS